MSFLLTLILVTLFASESGTRCSGMLFTWFCDKMLQALWVVTVFGWMGFLMNKSQLLNKTLTAFLTKLPPPPLVMPLMPEYQVRFHSLEENKEILKYCLIPQALQICNFSQNLPLNQRCELSSLSSKSKESSSQDQTVRQKKKTFSSFHGFWTHPDLSWMHSAESYSILSPLNDVFQGVKMKSGRTRKNVEKSVF